jgi:hypothetical protein
MFWRGASRQKALSVGRCRLLAQGHWRQAPCWQQMESRGPRAAGAPFLTLPHRRVSRAPWEVHRVTGDDG